MLMSVKHIAHIDKLGVFDFGLGVKKHAESM